MVYTVALEDLEEWLQNQPANTMDTPYEVIVSGLTTSNYTDLKNIIKYTTRYIGLSNTSIPNGVTSINDLFDTCPRLITPPILPDSITQMGYAFCNCTWMKYAPKIPTSVYNMQGTFINCTKLKDAPLIPDSVTDFQYTFQDCSSLENPPILGSSVRGVTKAFENCTSLLYKPIIPSSVRPGYDTDVFKNVTQTKWGGSTDQLETFVASQTTEFDVVEIEADTENNCYEMTGREVYGVDISNLENWLSEKTKNTKDTPYEIKVLELTTSNWLNIKDALTENIYPAKYVDLSYTSLPSGISTIYEGFMDCINLIKSPSIPSSVTVMTRAFVNCVNLAESPVIPGSVVSLQGCFISCTSLENPPTIPSSVRSMSEAFSHCKSLEFVPKIPNGVTDMSYCFNDCPKITEMPTIPSSVTNINYTFRDCINLETTTNISGLSLLQNSMSHTFEGCKKLTNAPTLPSGVTSMIAVFKDCTSLETVSIPSGVTNMNNAFEGCSEITEITLIPASVTKAKEAFKNCSSLRKINEFQIPLNTLKNNADFQNMFQGCTSLSEIGYVIKESSWHVWRLKFGADTVEGKVFFDENTSVNIPQTSITKSDLSLPILTDELWFPHGNDEDETAIDALIVKMLQNKYGVFKKTVLPPDQKNFVMWADSPNNFQTNLPISPQGIFDAVYPKGCVYTQYPGQKSPMEMWSSISTWEILDYGGAFFRSEGGNAGVYDNEKTVTAKSGAVITVPNHGAVAGCLVYDPVGNETRTVSSVSGNNLTLNSAFTSTNLTTVLIGQNTQNKYHNHTHSHTHAKGTYRIRGTVGYVQFMSGVTSSGAITTTEQGSPNSAWDGSTSARQLINFDTSARNGAGWTGNSATPNAPDTSYDGSSTDPEGRPVNMTIKIWKRVL